MVKSLPLHPLLKKKASVFEDMVPGSPEVRMFFLAVPPPFRKRASSRPPKKKKKKNFRKNLEDMLQTPYLCNRFPLQAGRRQDLRSLKELHKQYK